MKKKIVTNIGIGLVFAMSVTAFSGCSNNNNDDLSPTENVTSSKLDDASKYSDITVFTVGDDEIKLDEVMWYIYLLEDEFRQDAADYEKKNGSSYYDVVIDEDGNTVEDKVRSEIMDQISYYQIMYDQAKKSDKYKLESKETLEQQAKDKMAEVDKDIAKKCGLKEDVYEKIIEKWAYADLYYNDVSKLYDVDVESAIEGKYDKDELNQYNTQYLFVSYYNGSEKLSDDEIVARKNELNDVVNSAGKDSEFSSLASGNVTYGEKNFIMADSDSTSAEYKSAAMKLKNNEISDEIDTNEGCYVIKMIDNASKEYYDYVYDNFDESYRKQMFDSEFQTLEKDYPMTTNDEVWNELDIGNVTY